MQKTFNLIVATYGRYKEVDRLLDSFTRLEYNLDLVEIYIVDQNDKIDLCPIIKKYNLILRRQEKIQDHYLDTRLKFVHLNIQSILDLRY